MNLCDYFAFLINKRQLPTFSLLLHCYMQKANAFSYAFRHSHAAFLLEIGEN